MTAGGTASPAKRITRCVSELSHSTPPSSPELWSEATEKALTGTELPLMGRRRASRPVSDIKEERRPPLRRFVSQEFITCVDDRTCDQGEVDKEMSESPSSSVGSSGDVNSNIVEGRPSGSPMRCVSEFDTIAGAMDVESSTEVNGRLSSTADRATDAFEQAVEKGLEPAEKDMPDLPVLLHDPDLLKTHMQALRIEAELFPMRLILSRLMANPSHNRRGVFNTPVDPVALGLPDYFSIVENPMDLGTIKARLHAVAYRCRQDVANDIRLVFENAMKYNPQDNSVHQAARSLLSIFEAAYQGVETLPTNQSSDQASARCDQGKEPVSKSVPRSTRAMSLSSALPRDHQASQNLKAGVSVTAVSTASTGSAAGSVSQVSLQSDPPSLESGSAPPPESSLPEAADAATLDVDGDRVPVQGSQAKNSSHPSEPVKALRKARGSRGRLDVPHSCQSCLGRTCSVCLQGCLPLEPTLLICAGAGCSGAKIRKGAVYYISTDGSCQFCQRCYSNLSAVLPRTSDHSHHHRAAVRYKRDLLKRKNDEEIVEEWATCTRCGVGVHHVCAMHNKYVHEEHNYLCPSCVTTSNEEYLKEAGLGEASTRETIDDNVYTFISGSDAPVRLSEVRPRGFRLGEHVLTADALTSSPISLFMERKIQERMTSEDFPYAERTVAVRVLSDCEKYFNVPDVVRRHFRMETSSAQGSTKNHDGKEAPFPPPSLVKYKSKAFGIFQKIDGFDVCVFCMYVQEYDGDYEYEENCNQSNLIRKKRVYIAYLDSVEHFRPRQCRTDVYQEMLVAYLATARARGYEMAHIWACPPSRGNSFVFWNHPASQKTPTRDRLVSWYHGALSRAVDCGVVADIKSLYECAFEKQLSALRQRDANDASGSDNLLQRRLVCPPLLDGDFWIEEAVRIHKASMARHLKSKSAPRSSSSIQLGEPATKALEGSSGCPAILVALLLHDKIMTHPSSAPFRRPVNAAALKLKDYHKIISRPMDLGTVYSRCLLGEFESLRDLVAEVELVFTNAMRFNPKGHFIHSMAVEMRDLFFKELNCLVGHWIRNDHDLLDGKPSWLLFANLSMSLDARLSRPEKATPEPPVLDGGAPTLSSKHSQLTKSPKENDSDQVASEPTLNPHPPLSPLSTLTGSNVATGLLTGGPEAILQSMVGDDVWLMDKRNPFPPKRTKKNSGKRKHIQDCSDTDNPKRRRQTWLGEEVGESVRRLRTCFFTCSLTPKNAMTPEEEGKVSEYKTYVAPFVGYLGQGVAGEPGGLAMRHCIADTRHGLLEFSQYRNFEFGTLRRAKYSTAMLLYHLHTDAPGLVPPCSSCGQAIAEVRWHKIKNAVERRQGGRGSIRKGGVACLESKMVPAAWKAEELCCQCHSKAPNGDEFIPMQVSFHD